MALISPGVEVSVIDESAYAPQATGTVPLIVIATQQDKTGISGTGTAAGTIKANAGKLSIVSSQRELATLFGSPYFSKTVNGTPIHGSEVNEYGLMAAYSVLGVSNQAMVLRADVDLAALEGTSVRPAGRSTDGLYWYDVADTSFGISAWDAGTQQFTDVTVTPITSGGTPTSSYGNIGDYVSVATTTANQVYYKNRSNTWVAVGSTAWQASLPTVTGTISSTTISSGTLTLNTIAITSGTSFASLAAAINALTASTLPGVTAAVVNGFLEIYVTSAAASNGSTADGTLVIASGSVATAVGLTAGTYASPTTAFSTHTSVPQWKSFNTTPRPSGSVWVKTNSINNGASFSIKRYSSTLDAWSQVSAPIYANDQSAIAALDSSGGKTIATGTLYVQYNVDNDGLVNYKLFRRTGTWPFKVTGTATSPTFTSNDTFTVQVSVAGSSTLTSAATVTLTGTTADLFVTAVNNAGITNLSAVKESTGAVSFIHALGGVIVLKNTIGTPLTTAGITTSTTNVRSVGIETGRSLSGSTTFLYSGGTSVVGASTYTAVSQLSTSGSGTGATFTVQKTGSGLFYASTVSFSGTMTIGSISGTGPWTATVSGITSTTGAVVGATLTGSGGTGTLYGGSPSSVVIASFTSTSITYTVTGGTTPTAGTVTSFSQTGNTTITRVASGTGYNVGDTVTISGAVLGGALTTNNLTFTLGGSVTTSTVDLVASSWTAIAIGTTSTTYTASSTEPDSDPDDETPWYYSTISEVDIMIHDGSSSKTAWKGYRTVSSDARGYNLTNTDVNGIIIAASAPTLQSDGATSLVSGDLWLDTSDLENYPKLYRWQATKWVLIDNSDQTSENGIVFADARWDDNGITDVTSGTIATTKTLLSSSYLDIDAPDATAYPRGTLLFNTRRSGYNVKKYMTNYFNGTDFAFDSYSATTAYVAGNRVLYTNGKVYKATGSTTGTAPATLTSGVWVANTNWALLESNSWVTASGNRTDGSPYMGHRAVRRVVVNAMKSAIDSNLEIREDQREFTIIAAPGYPELIYNMVALNNDRLNTAFVIGDTPMTLSSDGIEIQNWSNGVSTGTKADETLSVSDDYLAVYYPSALSNDLTGNTIAVPPSHMVLRSMVRSDSISFPWFAPAGTQRGLVDNATSLGYVNSSTGEFVGFTLTNGFRDLLYDNKINPITYLPGAGITVYGQKTRSAATTAFDRINVSRLVSYIRNRVALLSRPFIFEPNDKITRDQLKQITEQMLNDLSAKRALYDFLVVCDTTNNTPARIDRNELYMDIAIEPVKAVEFIYIPLRIKSTGSITSNF